MPNLTEIKFIVLSKAAAHASSAAEKPEGMRPAALLKLGQSLVDQKLMREVRAKGGMPVWRIDEDGRPISLIITKAGRAAIRPSDQDPVRVEVDRPDPLRYPGVHDTVQDELSRQDEDLKPLSPRGRRKTVSGLSPAPAGSKQAKVIAMLSYGSGATMEALIASTGWLPHTTRAALSGLRKRGYAVERTLEADGRSRYRITGAAANTARS
jgi:DNA-binding MarR family transcriptional regulator